jgi:chlorobactene glucosyltransferase
MKRGLAGLMFATVISLTPALWGHGAQDQQIAQQSEAPDWLQLTIYKMTTPTPHQINAPDKVKTLIGTLVEISQEYYLISSSLICFFFLCMTYLNSKFIRRMTLPPGTHRFPMVSVLVPARNEESNIRNCLDSLLLQEYPSYEILVLDDQSDDRTGAIIEEYAENHEIVRAYRGRELPEGWNGKPFACQQLAGHARGEYLFFTDADTIHSPQSITWAVSNALGHRVDCLSAMPHHKIQSLGESIVVPVIYLMTAFFMPLWLIPRGKSTIFSFAIGQFILCRTDAFWEVGGFSLVSDSLVEDIALAKRMKTFGYRTIFLDAKNYIRCRMYIGYRGSVRGIIKSVYAALNQRILAIAGLWFLILFAVELPLVNLVYQMLSRGSVLYASIPVLLFLASWYKTLSDRKLRALLVFLYPIVFFNLLWLTFVSILKTGYGKGALWKGRLVKCHLPEPDVAQDLFPIQRLKKEK